MNILLFKFSFRLSGCFNLRLTRWHIDVALGTRRQLKECTNSFQCFLTTISFGESFRFELALWYHARAGDTLITTSLFHTVRS